MVFLGGAVLANIVSHHSSFARTSYFNGRTDVRQGEHVDLETGVARARTEDIRKARP